MRKIKQLLHSIFPVGSPLWLIYRKTKLQYKKISKDQSCRHYTIFEYTIHNNIVLHEYKSIYFPIPKVACSSIEAFCSELLGMDVLSDSNMLHEEVHDLHFPCVKKYKIRKRYPHYFKFCFVRNPWDRVVSCYKNKLFPSPIDGNTVSCEHFMNYHNNSDYFSLGMPFDSFVESVCMLTDDVIDSHLRSQFKYITDNSGTLLVDYIGKLENFDNDFNYVRKKMGVKDATIAHLMKSKHKNYREYYTEKTRELIRNRYEKDIQMFEYDF